MELESNQQLGQKLITKSIRQYVFFFFIAPIGYIIKLLLTNALSVADIGVLYGIINLVGLISIYNDFGLSDCIQYFIPKYAVKNDKKRIFSLISFTFFFQTLTGVIIIALLYIGSDWIALHYFKTPFAGEIIRLFCWYFVFLNVLQVTTNLFIAYQKPIYQGITDLIRMITIIGVILFFAWDSVVDLTIGAYARIIGSGVAMCIALFIFLVKYKSVYRGYPLKWEKADIHTWFKYAIWAFVGANVTLLFGQIDQLLIIGLGGVEVAGYYTVYQALFAVFAMGMTPFVTLVFPIMTQMIAENDTDKLHYFIRLLYKFLFMCGLIFAVILGIYGKEITVVLFSEKFAYSGTLAQRGAALQIVGGINWVSLLLYAARGSVKDKVHLVGGGLLLNILAVVIGYQLIGIFGAILGIGLGFIYILIRSHYTIVKKWHYPNFLDENFIARNLLFGILIFAIFFWLNETISVSVSRIWGGIEIIGRGLLITLLFSLFNISYLKQARQILQQNTHEIINKQE